jgi:hypothetical protein
MMCAAVFLDQTHPDASVLFEIRRLVRIDRVTNETSNQSRLLSAWRDRSGISERPRQSIYLEINFSTHESDPIRVLLSIKAYFMEEHE